jgi:hypothetical protein
MQLDLTFAGAFPAQPAGLKHSDFLAMAVEV